MINKPRETPPAKKRDLTQGPQRSADRAAAFREGGFVGARALGENSKNTLTHDSHDNDNNRNDNSNSNTNLGMGG